MGKVSKPFTCQFIERDLRANGDFDCGAESSYDIVSCQFAMHYFHESEAIFARFMSTVSNALKPSSGVYIASAFDGYRVFDLCAKGDNQHMKNGAGFEIIPEFDVRMGLGNIKSREFAIPVTVVLNGEEDVILKEPTTEYMIFPDQYILRMERLGFRLLETQLFSNLRSSDAESEKMSDVEAAYSDLHRYYVFMYMPNELAQRQPAWIEFSPPADSPLFAESESLKESRRLYRRRLGPQETVYPMLDLITGRSPYAADDTSFGSVAQHYNIFITVIADDEWTTATYSPTDYLEDVKHVFLFQDGVGDFHLVARESIETSERWLWFPIVLPDGAPQDPNDENAGDDCEDVKNVINAMAGVSLDETVERVEPVEGVVQVGSRTLDLNAPATFTLADLQVYAKGLNIKIPSAVARKADRIAYVQNEMDVVRNL